MARGARVVNRGKIEDAPQAGDTPGVDGGRAVVDELLGNEVLEIPDGVEHLAEREGRGGVLANQPKPS